MIVRSQESATCCADSTARLEHQCMLTLTLMTSATHADADAAPAGDRRFDGSFDVGMRNYLKSQGSNFHLEHLNHFAEVFCV